MLVLSRKKGEQIRIGDDIVITVQRLSGNRVSLGIEAPAHCRITRAELKTLLEELEYAPSSAERDGAVSRTESPAVRPPVSAKLLPAKTAIENRIAAHFPSAFRTPK